MKRKFISIIALTLLASLLTACMETPTNEIVIGKGDVTLEQTIDEKSDAANIGAYEAPQTLESSSEKNGLSLSVSANVDVPDSTRYSVASVVPEEISQETADKIWDKLIGDTVLYEELEWDYKTKAETEQLILELQKIINDSDEPQQKDLENLEKWQNWYNEAPETLDLTKTSKTFKEIDIEKSLPETPEGLTQEEEEAFEAEMDMIRASSNKKEIVGTGTDDGFTVELHITEDSATYSKYLGQKGFNTNILPKDPDVIYDSDGISLDTALEDAQNTMASMGLDYFVLSHTLDGYEMVQDENGEFQENRPAYIFTFTRELNGVAENVLLYDLNTDEGREMYFNPAVQNEYVKIIITNDGLVFFEWQGPSKIKEIVSENVELMSFDKVQETLEKQIFLSVGSLDIEKQLTGLDIALELSEKTIVIDSVKLGMARVMRQGHEEEYLIIPVWDISGYESVLFSEDDALSAQSYLSNYIISDDGVAKSANHKTYLTINALDGSIIDRAKGY